MASSSALRIFFTTKIPTLRTTSLSQSPSKNLKFLRPIAFERIATNSPPLKASTSPPSSVQAVEDLPPKLQEIVRLFQSVQEPKAKYEQLLFYGKNLKPLSGEFKTKKNKVEGCVSQVWVRAFLDSDRNVVFEADSDSVLTKGLAALLVNGLSGRPVDEILRVSPDFVILLGLHQSLTPSRNNGFLNMLKLMQRKALELLVGAENPEEPSTIRSDSDPDRSSSLGEDDEPSSMIDSEKAAMEIDSDSDNSGPLGRRGMRIREILTEKLSPAELEVDDVSYQHAGHAGARGADGETHFNVKVVSEEFRGKSLVKRHRLVYGLLQEELESGLHALSIVAKTPEEVS